MLVIVNFEISSFPVDLLLLFEEVRSGLLHWPYKEPSLYSSIARFGDSEISHDKVTEMKLVWIVQMGFKYSPEGIPI